VAFISAKSSQTTEQQEGADKPSVVKCKEGQDEVFDNCVRDDSPSKEQVEDSEGTVDEINGNE
jgi:hypothetical protein